MMRWKFLPGKISARITSANPASFLTLLMNSGLSLRKVRYVDDLTVSVTIQRKDYDKIGILAQKNGAAVRRTGFYSLLNPLYQLAKRPVLLCFLLTVILFACVVPSRILFISVEGNSTIPDKYILEVAGECGIGFGANRRSVRSEKVKNRLLESIPQLQWAGINTAGCTAVISVQEKTTQEQNMQAKHAVSSITAARDGIIQSCTVFQGNALCTVGQAVKAGQVLVSGYLDCGIVIKATQADAEIRALTSREIEVVMPSPTIVRGENTQHPLKFSLRIGKKLIKFYKDSGNCDTSCGKIYLEEYVQLPGGFYLPIAIIKEAEVSYRNNEDFQAAAALEEWLNNWSCEYLKSTMIGGEIVSANTVIRPSADGYCLSGRFLCIESIGQTVREQTLTKDDDK